MYRRNSKDREYSRERDRSRYTNNSNNGRRGGPILDKPSTNKQYDQRDKFAGDFVSICLKNLNDAVSDSEIRDSVYHEFKRFGSFNVKVVYDRNTRDHRHAERIAFVNFNSHGDASEAKRCKMNVPFYGYPLYIEPVFKNKANDYRPSRVTRRSPSNGDLSPPPQRKRYVSPGANKSSDAQRRYNRHSSRSPRSPPKIKNKQRTTMRNTSSLSPALTLSPSPPPVHHLQNKRRTGGANRMPRSLTPPPLGPPPTSRHQHARPRDVSVSSSSSRSTSSRRHSNGFKYRDHRKHIDPAFDKLANRTIFIGALDPDIEKDELQRLFARFGHIEEIDLKHVPNKKAYAFIRYVNLDMAYNAKCEMSGEVIGKFEIKIGYGSIRTV